MDKIQNNSHRSRQPNEKPEEVKQITSAVTVRKKTAGRRLMENVFPSRPEDVVDYVIWEVLIPNTKDAVLDAALSFVEKIFTGDSRGGNRRRRPGQSSQSGAGSFDYHSQSQPQTRQMSRDARSRHDFKEILFDTRAEAEEILITMETRIDKYKAVTVADYYGMVGLSGDYTDDKWGWKDLNSADIVRNRGQYYIDLPPTSFLD